MTVEEVESMEPGVRRALGRSAASIALACLVLALDAPIGGGVARGDQSVCTTIGCGSGVSFNLTDLHRHYSAVEHVTVCVGVRCERFSGRASVVKISLADAHAPGPVEVRLVVHGRQGQVRLRLTRTVTLRSWKPNGLDCPPTCWVRSLRVDAGAHRLVATN
jgi:hypothetical protein